MRQQWQQLPHFKMTLDIPYSNISTGRAIRLTLLNNNQVDNNGNRQYVTKYSIVKGFSQFSVSIIRTLDVWHEMGNFSGKILESTPKYIICLCFSKWFIFYTNIFVSAQLFTHVCYYEMVDYSSCSLHGWSNNARRGNSCFVFIFKV